MGEEQEAAKERARAFAADWGILLHEDCDESCWKRNAIYDLMDSLGAIWEDGYWAGKGEHK